MAEWIQDGSKCVGCFLRDHLADSCGRHCPATQKGMYHMSLDQEKIQIQKVQFLLKVYRFCIPVKLKNGKWSQDMLGTVCEGLPAALERLGEEQQRGMSWTRGTGLLTSGGAPSSGRKNTPSQGRGKTAPSFYERAEARLLGS